MPTALIADDEPHLAEDLHRRLIQLWPELEIVQVAANGMEAVAALSRQRPDLAFLDIRMPGLDGLQVAGAARDCRVVFVTAYDQYALAAFDAAAVDYLLKPVSDARLLQCVQRLRQEVKPAADFSLLLQQLAQPARSQLRWLPVGLGTSTRLVALDEVLYFRANDKYTEVVTAHERHLIRTSLKDLLPQLDAERFVQIHRSVIVCLAAVDRIERDLLGRHQVHLKERDEVLPVSRNFAGAFRQL
jgi:DNA-binding LytR/AlgR family response regulator